MVTIDSADLTVVFKSRLPDTYIVPDSGIKISLGDIPIEPNEEFRLKEDDLITIGLSDGSSIYGCVMEICPPEGEVIIDATFVGNGVTQWNKFKEEWSK
jgi:hypothetical protein